MSKKTEEAYHNLFKYIEDRIFNLEADSFTTDYEKAMRNGVKSVYPNVVMVACWFHYTQAVRRKCSKIGNFFYQCSNNEIIDRLFDKFLAIPHLPPNNIREAFSLLKLAVNCMTNKEPFEEFLKYYEKQWQRKVRTLFFLVIRTIIKIVVFTKNLVNMTNICHIYHICDNCKDCAKIGEYSKYDKFCYCHKSFMSIFLPTGEW